jgi:hypothetical protein
MESAKDIHNPYPNYSSSSDSLASRRWLAWLIWDCGKDPRTPTLSGWEEFWSDDSLSKREEGKRELIKSFQTKSVSGPDFSSSNSNDTV